MQVSQKCQYAVRAIFELALRRGEGPVKVGDIAEAQAIPARFLEVILSELRKGGFVESRRGSAGGYALARSPRELTVAEVVRFIEGPLEPVTCVVGQSDSCCPLYGGCVFLEVWQDALKAMSDVFEAATFQGLVERHKRKGAYVESYVI